MKVRTLDEKGRCCGRKPLVYKRSHGPGHPRQKFCDRCCRAYGIESGEQIENWAWKVLDGEFRKCSPLTGEPIDSEPETEGPDPDEEMEKAFARENADKHGLEPPEVE